MKTPNFQPNPQHGAECKGVRSGIAEDLKAYLDGELPPLRRLTVRFHLRQCAACRAEVQAMTQISQDLQNSEGATPALAPELRERILGNLPDAPPVKTASQGSVTSVSSSRGASMWEYSIGFALLALIVVGGFSLSGKRVSQTFNKAADQMNDGYSESYRAYSPSSGAASSTAGAPPKSNADESNSTAARTGKVSAFSAQDSMKAAAPSANTSSSTSNLPAVLRRVHKEARLTVAVDDVEAKSAAAEQSIRAAGGYVVSNDLSTGDDNRKSASLDLRVPVGRFDSIVGELSRLGEVRVKQVTGQDITEQFSDSQQAKNVLSNELSIREAQLKAALDKIAKSKKKERPADPWELRGEVRRLRVEAAQARARLELMRKLSDLSVISLQLTEKSLTPTNGFSKEMNETMSGAGDTFMAAVRLPLKLLIWAFAYSPLWLPLLLAYRLLARRVALPAAQVPGQSVAHSGASPGSPGGASRDAN